MDELRQNLVYWDTVLIKAEADVFILALSLINKAINLNIPKKKTSRETAKYVANGGIIGVVSTATYELFVSNFGLGLISGRFKDIPNIPKFPDEKGPEIFREKAIHSMVLEAITTLKCNESFSMERLELLGDSVLKFAVSCDLYLEYATTQEGQLSSRRSWQVCNSTLYNLGIACRLQGYKRDTAFVPTGWTTPRQLTLKPFPCDHGIGTIEVPVESKYQTEDPIIHTGQCCDMGHRWLCAVHLAAT
ncbi:endoribonuclease Dicer homolog 3a isoform X1 [Tanacetum coccineum]